MLYNQDQLFLHMFLSLFIRNNFMIVFETRVTLLRFDIAKIRHPAFTVDPDIMFVFDSLLPAKSEHAIVTYKSSVLAQYKVFVGCLVNYVFSCTIPFL